MDCPYFTTGPGSRGPAEDEDLVHQWSAHPQPSVANGPGFDLADAAGPRRSGLLRGGHPSRLSGWWGSPSSRRPGRLPREALYLVPSCVQDPLACGKSHRALSTSCCFLRSHWPSVLGVPPGWEGCDPGRNHLGELWGRGKLDFVLSRAQLSYKSFQLPVLVLAECCSGPFGAGYEFGTLGPTLALTTNVLGHGGQDSSLSGLSFILTELKGWTE